MSGDDPAVTRRQYLAGATAAAGVGLAGCLGSSGPLEVTNTQIHQRGAQFEVGVILAVENTADTPHEATMVVELSHTEAHGSIEEERVVTVAGDGETTVRIDFGVSFEGGWPAEGEWEVDTAFEDVEELDGTLTPTGS